ncbi:MAG: glutamate racemase [Desulfuromonadales bacterium]|nr:glutamate racemase [Desulfuromonadales bacterium]NIS43846.1 glutamate racemase [Desulfuromonadales bacterium]
MSGEAIGIFDSGVGGLTVLKEISRLLPAEDLVYLGDTARVPYGTKSPETVCQYARQAGGFLTGLGVKMLVVACNTASAVALEVLKEEFDFPVVGVIEPGAAAVAGRTRLGRVGVIGTEGTVKSDAYARAIKAHDDTIDVVSAACPLFVPLAEEGWADHRVAHLAAEEYLKPISAGIDALVLGCTHYPLLKNTLHRVLGDEVMLVDSAEETARAVRQALGGADNSGERDGCTRFYVTDVPTRFERVGSAFLGRRLEDVHQVSLSC